MRAYPIVQEDPDDGDYRRVIPITSVPRGRSQAADEPRPRHEPWTPREAGNPAVSTRAVAPPTTSRRPARGSQMPRLMLVTFFLVCAAMTVTMLAWRFWWSTPDAGEPAPAAVAPAQPAASTGSLPDGEPATTAPAGSGAVVTDVRVLQPTYVVAPGDTLASIARRHETTIEALASINNLENRNSLRVGQRLILP